MKYEAAKEVDQENSNKEGGIISKINQRRKRALIVSISNYKNLETLDFCQNDGKEMYSLLKSLGYEMFNDNKLIGGEVKYEDLRKGLIDLLIGDKNIHPQDTLLFYFSGHGLPDGYDGTYLATSDIDPDIPLDKGISFDIITDMMNISKSKRIVVILDCCCSGSIGLTKGDENTTASLLRSSIEKKSKILKEGEGKCILAASTGTQEAYGSKKQDHSIFTYHLLAGLRGAYGESVDKYGNITPESLSNYVYDKVTEQTSIKQKPISKVDTSGRIILASYPEFGKNDISGIDISGIINEAIYYYENQKYEQSLELFDKAIQLSPQNFLSYQYKGNILFKQRNYNESLEYFNKSLDININNVRTLLYKGNTLFQLKRYEDAIKCYDIVLTINPIDSDALKYKEMAVQLIRGRINRKSKYEIIDASNEPKRINPQISASPTISLNGNSKQKGFSNLHFYSFVIKWGSKSGPFRKSDGKFSKPRYVAVDSSDAVYVTDKHRIQKFDSNGNFITKWGSYGTGDGEFGEGEFGGPTGIAVDSSGYIYVVDRGNICIQKFDSNGNFITKWGSYGTGDGEFNGPTGIAIDSSGYVYVTDLILKEGDNKCILKFGNNGNFITKWGSYGTGDGEFNYPTGIAVDSSDYVYVVDSGDNKCIQKFDSNGNFITKWGSPGTGYYKYIAGITIDSSGEGEFNYPTGIAVDSSDYVYVVDSGNRGDNKCIQKFDSNGNFITKWGSTGTGDGEFNGPTGIVVNSQGAVYVVDSDNHRIQKFDSNINSK